jgi:YidC/Oxa1 family membrane protein insertase
LIPVTGAGPNNFIMTILYTIIIKPLVFIIELFFMVFNRMLNPGMAVIVVSVTVSILTYPFYTVAEKWRRIERDTQNRLAPKIAKIKAAFKGDERHMILSVYYRQNHYHPVYALRNSFGLLIQIPFFIAAYTYLSHLPLLNGTSFFFIKNLAEPDGLIPLFGGINLLPILMTVINGVSSAVYTRGLSKNDAFQLYGMAAVFLILLYNSPAGLVLYWTCNNIFSLIKNILTKFHLSWKTLYIAVSAVAIISAFYLLFVFDKGYYVKRAALASCFLMVCFIPFLIKLAKKIEKKFIPVSLFDILPGKCFIISSLILCILTGLSIPAALISSSVEEFSFISPFSSPNPFLINTLLQAAGLFIFWPFCVYTLFSKKTKSYLAMFFVAAGFAALINTYLFTGNYGFLSVTLSLSNPVFSQKNYMAVLEAALILFVCIIGAFFFIYKKKLLSSIQVILLISLSGFSLFNIIKIQLNFADYARTITRESFGGARLEPVYTFSDTGKNVLVVMLDRAFSPYIPYIFEEKPELNASFSGFVWYPNCVSLGGLTLTGAPPLYGGYEYAPDKFGKNNGVPLVEKHNQSLLVMPLIFSENGFTVTVTDPTWANYSYKSDISIYDAYPEIKADKIIGKYTGQWMQENPDVKVFDAADFLKNNLLRFSFLRICPPFLRFFVYDDGKWLVETGNTGEIPLLTMDEYIALDMLPKITKIDDSGINTLTIITNNLTHESAFFQAPEYKPAINITDKGGGLFAGRDDYHANMAAILLLSNFFIWLQDNNSYDNTRIIVVADHGWDYNVDFDGNVVLPNSRRVESYNPLLLVKDFNERGSLRTDKTFMTNADTPFLAVNNLIPNAKNPWTGNPIMPDKDNGVIVNPSGLWSPDLNSTYEFRVTGSNLKVHTNIFDPKNWSIVTE